MSTAIQREPSKAHQVTRGCTGNMKISTAPRQERCVTHTKWPEGCMSDIKMKTAPQRERFYTRTKWQKGWEPYRNEHGATLRLTNSTSEATFMSQFQYGLRLWKRYCSCHENMKTGHPKSCSCHANWSEHSEPKSVRCPVPATQNKVLTLQKCTCHEKCAHFQKRTGHGGDKAPTQEGSPGVFLCETSCKNSCAV